MDDISVDGDGTLDDFSDSPTRFSPHCSPSGAQNISASRVLKRLDSNPESGVFSMTDQKDTLDTDNVDKDPTHCLQAPLAQVQITENLCRETTFNVRPVLIENVQVEQANSTSQNQLIQPIEDNIDESYVSLTDSPLPVSLPILTPPPVIGINSDDTSLLEVLQRCETTLRPCESIHSLDEQLYRRDLENNTLLHWSTAVGWEDVTVSIIRHTRCPQLLDLRNDLRQTPLVLACLTQQSAVVRELVKAGADLSLVDRHGDSAYHIAARNGDLETLVVICQNVDEDLMKVLNTQNSSGLCPVHLAAIIGHMHIISYLHHVGADMNCRDGKAGYTPIHHAIRSHREAGMKMVRFLTERVKVDLHLTDYSERTPLMFAEKQRCIELVSYLVVHGPGRNWLSCPPFSETESELEDEDMGFVEN